MSISQNFPEEGPTLNLNFANSKTLDPRITFTRTSSATYTDDNGLIRVAPANSARFDHRFNPTTGEIESLGLLVEEQRSNLITYSEQLDDGSWGKINVTISPNSIASPSGEIIADKIIEDSSNNIHYVSKSASGVTQGNVQTFSFYAKAAERTIIRFENIQGAGRRGFVDLSTGTITDVTIIGTGGLDSFSESITYVGNGWWRIISTIDPTVGSSSPTMTIMLVTSGTNITYQGDGSSGVYIWGAQLEAGAFPTSYIPTAATTATRTADNASITGTNFSSWYNQSEGTVYCNFSISNLPDNLPNSFDIWRLNQLGINYIGLRTASGYTPDRLFPACVVSNVAQFSGEGTANTGYLILPQKIVRNSFSYKTNDFSSSFNGNIPYSSTSGTLPSPSNLTIGSGASISHLNGTIAQLTYYPVRLTNAQLQTLTR